MVTLLPFAADTAAVASAAALVVADAFVKGQFSGGTDASEAKHAGVRLRL